jgi:hypothetical protein
MKRLFAAIALGSIGCLTATVLVAQAPMGLNVKSGQFSAGMRKLFGETKAFSARMEMQVTDKAGKEIMNAPLNFAMLDNKVRTEIDMGTMKSSQMPPGASEQLKQLGMDKLVSIIRPDTKQMLIVYPNLKSYVEMPLPKEEQEAQEKQIKIDKTEQGKETVDGNACVKYKVVLTDEAGVKQEGLVWEAKDLKNFPVKMQFAQDDTTFVMTYKSIQFAKPDEGQFGAPAEFTKHTDMQAMMQSVMQKMIQQQGGGQK